MTRKHRVIKHKESIKVVSENIDKNWKYDEDMKKFYHPIYPNKYFDPICSNNNVGYKVKKKNRFGKEYTEKKNTVFSTLYPYISPEDDPRNLGFTLSANNSALFFTVVPNKMQSFWDTRRGKRFISYIAYRKRRDANRKTWMKENGIKINNE